MSGISKLVEQWQDEDGVVYMLTGIKHAAMLVVSIMSLRQHYHGPVCLIAGDGPSIDICNRIKQDKVIGVGVTVKEWPAPVGGGKNGHVGERRGRQRRTRRLVESL